MAIVILGKSLCPLCNKIMQKDEITLAYPAFLPSTHRLGKFSDAAFHKTCIENDLNFIELQGLFKEFTHILNSRPKTVRSLKEMDDWTKMAFKNWPPNEDQK